MRGGLCCARGQRQHAHRTHIHIHWTSSSPFTTTTCNRLAASDCRLLAKFKLRPLKSTESKQQSSSNGFPPIDSQTVDRDSTQSPFFFFFFFFFFSSVAAVVCNYRPTPPLPLAAAAPPAPCRSIRFRTLHLHGTDHQHPFKNITTDIRLITLQLKTNHQPARTTICSRSTASSSASPPPLKPVALPHPLAILNAPQTCP